MASRWHGARKQTTSRGAAPPNARVRRCSARSCAHDAHDTNCTRPVIRKAGVPMRDVPPPQIQRHGGGSAFGSAARLESVNGAFRPGGRPAIGGPRRGRKPAWRTAKPSGRSTPPVACPGTSSSIDGYSFESGRGCAGSGPLADATKPTVPNLSRRSSRRRRSTRRNSSTAFSNTWRRRTGNFFNNCITRVTPRRHWPRSWARIARR